MRFIMLIYGVESAWADEDSPDETLAMEEHATFESEVSCAGIMPGGDALHRVATATTVRSDGGTTTCTDGPFAETHEQLGGYYILDCRDKAHALELAARMPGVKRGTSTIEVRPIREFS